MNKNYRLIAIRRFCSRIAVGSRNCTRKRSTFRATKKAAITGGCRC